MKYVVILGMSLLLYLSFSRAVSAQDFSHFSLYRDGTFCTGDGQSSTTSPLSCSQAQVGKACTLTSYHRIYVVLYDNQPLPTDSPLLAEIYQYCASLGYEGAVTGQTISCIDRNSVCGEQVERCIDEPSCAPQQDQGGIGGVTAGTFDQLNIAIFGKKPDASLTTPRGIIGRALPYLFVFGGLTLFVMIIWGGFEMMSGAMNPKNQEAGKQRMTAAIMGFILLFISYWIAQIVEIVLGVSIL